jgi:hypothetical protein
MIENHQPAFQIGFLSTLKALSLSNEDKSIPYVMRNRPETVEISIIGAGTAGGIFAHQLSADPRLRNLLTARWHSRTLGNPEYDWLFKTIPEPGLNSRVISQSPS